MSQFKCKCGQIIESDNKTGVNCPVCKKSVKARLHKCVTCGEVSYFTSSSINCKKCAIRARTEAMRKSDKGFKREEIDLELEALISGKHERIKHIIRHNWWSNREFCYKVAECEKVEDAEKLLLDLNRYYGKMQYIRD